MNKLASMEMFVLVVECGSFAAAAEAMRRISDETSVSSLFD